jgi:hypothetical protein
MSRWRTIGKIVDKVSCFFFQLSERFVSSSMLVSLSSSFLLILSSMLVRLWRLTDEQFLNIVFSPFSIEDSAFIH